MSLFRAALQSFRESMAEEGKDAASVESILSRLYAQIDPVRTQALDFLRELESRFSAWSTRLEAAAAAAAAASSSKGSGDSSGGSGRHSAGRSVSHGADLNNLGGTNGAPIRVGDLFVTNLKMLQVRCGQVTFSVYLEGGLYRF